MMLFLLQKLNDEDVEKLVQLVYPAQRSLILLVGNESDFFERAQLNAEEEREFFLLNQQLSESVEH